MLTRIIVCIALASLLWSHAAFAKDFDPCGENILTIVKRPTVMTSACVTPSGMYTFEGGVNVLENLNKTNGTTSPLMKVRAGLPWRNEIALIFPNVTTNTKKGSGTTATQVALKHEFYYNEHWNTAMRAIYIPTSGSYLNGTAQSGYILNGILAYTLNQFNASLMLGYASESTPKASGGQRYSTFSPDVEISWQATSWLQWYGEVYGQSHTGPNLGPGYNMDTGLLFLIKKYIEADIEFGHRLSGKLFNLEKYYGAGFSVLF